jgi:hypothetical protein
LSPAPLPVDPTVRAVCWRARWFRDLAGDKDKALQTPYRVLRLRDVLWRFSEAVR